MLAVLKQRSYRHLFAAQVASLVGTGLATVALALLAFNLAGANAGAVLGTALAIKMLAYVGVAPLATALTQRWSRRSVLVTLDLVRAGVALCLPFVTQVWQIYGLIFLLQAASAAFTPTFQATIPDVLPDERDYTHALSLSRLAYDLESLLSPVLAAVLLTVIGFHDLFAGTALGFGVSAVLVVTVALPPVARSDARPFVARTLRGLRIYLATPRLRGLLAVSAATAAAGSMVFVNTVVLVQGRWGLPASAQAWALAAFGIGSMLAALALPRWLDRWPDRRVMLTGATLLGLSVLAGSAIDTYAALLALWALAGLGYSAALTPAGRLLRRSAGAEDRPALFAAQFALSHAAWLVFYPLAGWAGVRIGLPATFVALGLSAWAACAVAARCWPAHDPDSLEHSHGDLPPDHPHLQAVPGTGHGARHAHAFHIDDQHPHWPRHGQ